MTRYKWTKLADDIRANAGARVLLKRAYRRWRIGNGALDRPTDDLEAWARTHFGAVTRGLRWQVTESTRLWEKGNNSGNAQTLADCNERSEWHSENHDTACAALGVGTSWPGLYPVYSLDGADYYSLESLAAAMDDKHGPARTIRIEGRRWFRKHNGSTYYSARSYVNGREVKAARIEFAYGYDQQYMEDAFEALEKCGRVEKRKPRGKFVDSPWRHCSENGIKLDYSAVDVPRKKDL